MLANKEKIEYRDLAAPFSARAQTKRLNTEYYVEGYATTFNTRYCLFELEDGTKIYEQIDARALEGADGTDVIMRYDHRGRVFARQSNQTLLLEADGKGLFIAADLGKTDFARNIYQDIATGMITKMSWAFTVAEENYDKATRTRTILKIRKIYDVAPVSIPASESTEISARSLAKYEEEQRERIKRRTRLLSIMAGF